MRSAGCVINDIFDRNFDKNVARTKLRPLASGAISLKQALILLAVLLSLSFWILWQFSLHTIILGFFILGLVILYPLCKRFTYYPQIFLGIVFNFGIIMAAAEIIDGLNLPIILLYASSILWTIIYDSIYAYQDLEDDMQIGIKSTAIKFGPNPKFILNILTTAWIIPLFAIGYILDFKPVYYILISLAYFFELCAIHTCNFKNSQDCLKKFKANLWVGVILLIAIILG